VQLNVAGDVSSVFDKNLKKELLSAPIRMAFSNDTPKQWPAVEHGLRPGAAAPVSYVGGPAKIRIKESGPVRVSIECRASDGIKVRADDQLGAGDAGNRVEFANKIDWRRRRLILKVAFR